jgi:hypothetical protein
MGLGLTGFWHAGLHNYQHGDGWQIDARLYQTSNQIIELLQVNSKNQFDTRSITGISRQISSFFKCGMRIEFAILTPDRVDGTAQ